MSFTSIVKVLPEALRHPAGLTMIGSFAFHGFLFAGGIPLVPGDSDAIDSRRLVSLIKLSPAEQSRLPQAASSQIPPLPQPPSDLSSFVLPPLSKLPDVSQQPELFNPPSNLLSPDLPPPSVGSIPSSGSVPTLRMGGRLPVFSPDQIPSQTREGFNPFSPPSNSETPPAPSPSPPPPSLDQVMKDIKPGEVDDFGSGSPPSDQQIDPIDPSLKKTFENQPLPDQPVTEEPGTSKGLDDMNQWLAKAHEISGDPGLAAQNIKITPDYPKAACQDRHHPEGSTIVGAIVRPNGELAEAPTLQGTAGNKILDNAALDIVRSYPFKPSGRYQAFLPTLSFKYSEAACAGGSAESTPPPSPSESPAINNQSLSPNESPSNLSQSLSDARQKESLTLVRKPLSVTYSYPKEACDNQLEGQALVESKVTSNGKLAEEPVVKKPTGHSILDNAAVEAVKKHQFTAMGQPQAFVSGFGFEYSEAACSKAEESGSSDDDSESPEGAASKSSGDSEEGVIPEDSPEATEGPTSQESPENPEETTAP